MAEPETPVIHPPRLPGDRAPDTRAMIRVDQAGEYGAMRIYAGQLAVLGNRAPAARDIARMRQQEERHLTTFNRLASERQVRPTLLQPLWHVGGFALGAVTALLGEKAAMACTVAVETEIDRHYSAQRAALGDSDPELSSHIADFQAEEVEHRDTALAHDAESAPGYSLLSTGIRGLCRMAIRLSERI